MSRVFWYRWIVVCIVGAAAAYAGITFNRQETVRSKLDALLQQTIEEKDQLQSTISSMEVQIREKEGQLNQLQDVQSIRQSLAAAQSTVDTIKKAGKPRARSAAGDKFEHCQPPAEYD
jgi:TolA-binding protein